MKDTKAESAQRAATYCRVSTAGQVGENKTSLPEQRRACRNKSKEKGWQIVGEFEDPALSGELVETRPGMQALLASCDRGEVDWIVCRGTDRLWRGPDAYATIRRVVKRAGVRIWTIERGEMDVRAPTSSVFAGVEIMIREYIAENMERGKTELLEAGQWPRGQAPFGYTWNKEAKPKRLEVAPEEKRHVISIFRWYVEEGLSTTAIAQRLNDRAVATKHAHQNGRRVSGVWAHGTVRNVLQNEAYVGTLRVYRTRLSKDGKPTYLPRPGSEGYREGTWLPIACESIVDRGLWDRAQRLRTERARRYLKNPARHYLLRGMVFCGGCGKPMSGSTLSTGYAYYRCLTSRRGGDCGMAAIRADEIEKNVFDWIGSYLLSKPERVAAWGEDPTRKQHMEDLREQRDRMQANLRNLDGQRDRARNSYVIGLATEAVSRAEAEHITRDMAGVQRRLRQVEAQLAQGAETQTAIGDAIERWMGKFERMAGELRRLAPEETRRLFEEFQVRVEVGEDRVIMAAGIDMGAWPEDVTQRMGRIVEAATAHAAHLSRAEEVVCSQDTLSRDHASHH